jgi:TatD DNase family protein
MVTFRTWSLVDRVRECPAERLLVETDAPYLAPVPHRGRRNEPAFVRAVAARVAELRDESMEEVIRQTSANAARCFGSRVLGAA